MRLTCPVLVVATLLSSTALANDADDAYRKIAASEWAWQLNESPLSATSVGVHDFDAHLDDVSEAAWQRRRLHRIDTLHALQAIAPGEMSASEKINYRILKDQVESAIDQVALGGYLMPLNSDSAFYSDIQQLPRAQPLNNLSDYQRYLTRLGELPRYFEQNIALMAAGIKRGMTLPRVVLEGRDVPIAAEADRRDPTGSAFYAPFVTLPDSIEARDAAALREQAQRAIREQITPAYAKLLKFWRERYLPAARKSLGAEQLPQGKAFYRRQILDYTTLDIEPERVHQTGLSEVKRIRLEMQAIIDELKFDGDFAAFLKFLRSDPQFYAKSPEELLMRASWIAKRVDAQLPKFFGHLPRLPFGIAPVPEAIAPYYTGGRYVPPADGSTEPGYYWVNTSLLDSRPLYTQASLTLHEAVPGHHLQGAIANEQGEQPPHRRYNYISAFGEGWALYAEHLGVEMGIYRTPYEHFGRLTYEMWRACRLVIDTGIHAKGWTRDQAIAYLHDNTALSDHEISTEVDRYISWPGQALSYKLGELKIRELRARAEQQLGDKFDLRAFHDSVLALGSVPLPVLEDAIDEFIAARKAAPVSAGG